MSEKFRKSEYFVKDVEIQLARKLIEQNHYAKSASNTGVYIHGLFHTALPFVCLGIAWWLPPTKNAAIATYPEGRFQEVLALTRLAIISGVPSNAASFLLSQSRKKIDRNIWKCLVTYADTYQNHTGSIYRADNWEYLGLTKPQPIFVSNEGKMMGRKRAGKNIPTSELIASGFTKIGVFAKHKFRKLL